MSDTYRAFTDKGEMIVEAVFFTDDIYDREFAALNMLALVRSEIPGTKEWREAKLREAQAKTE